jgi:extracellular elastinolytic metalloproteinase
MRFVVEAMKLQPCIPDFVQARDDILDADVTLTGGINAWETRDDLDKVLDSGARHGITSTGSKTSPSRSYYGNGLEYS